MIVRHNAAARESAPRRRRLVVSAALVGLLLLAGLLSACSGDGADGATGRQPTRAEVTALLTRHAAALRDRDRGAFLADLVGSYRARQADVYENIAAVPLAGWSYTLGPRVDDTDAQRQARRQHGSSAVIMRVSLRYRLQGVDAAPDTHDVWWTFVRRGSGVGVVSDTDLAGAGGRSWRGPWDFGPVVVRSGTSALVLAHPDDASLLPRLVADVDRAVPRVTAVVGSDWTRRVAVVVPGSPAERTEALGPVDTGDAPVAALAVSSGTDPVTGAVLGQRVVVDPDQFRRVSESGGRLLLQHEITHVATARYTTSSTPTWLREGFADYVGYLGNERPVRAAAAELAALVRRSGVPASLPDSASFAGAGTAAAAYELSWLACRRIAEDHGQAALVRFYRTVGADPVPSGEAVDAAIRSVLRETPARFVARTRAYVGAELG